ncbi:MAG: methylmalonyl Co-A mutase-associated GTPase MeaB [Rhodobacteraceae bacterium]|nr:methylmalonyl Co-A mutase-associated GTPase MeaB [Paracoccaceae bacterium]
MCDPHALAKLLMSGDRRSLARAITLIESSRPEHRTEADALMEALSAGGVRQALRIALTGSPGVGKSTLIDALGIMLTQRRLKVAVLAIDPSSVRTGGSILGDKTRMERLAREPLAFIRPTPTNTVLGGVAVTTKDTVFLCEQAGFDVIVVETTGVGQSETVAAELTDVFVLLVAAAGGDELQGVKRGIMEKADLVMVTKADGVLQAVAAQTCAHYSSALKLLARRPSDPENYPQAVTVSALEPASVESFWTHLKHVETWRRDSGVWQMRRARQDVDWVKSELRERVLLRAECDPRYRETVANLEAAVLRHGSAFHSKVRAQLREALQF